MCTGMSKRFLMSENGGVAVSLYRMEYKNQTGFYRKEGSLPGKCAFLSQKETPRCLCFHASFTLEAAVILPLLACFFVSVLFFFRVMQIEIIVQKTLDDTGRKLAVYLAEKEGGVELLEAEALFLKELTGKELPEKYIENGRLGILLLSSQFDEREVALEATYRIKLPIQMFAIDGLWVRQNAVCRKWNGWKPDQAGGDHEEWVYITETGRAYHREDTCSYLDLSIRSVKPEQLDNLRNENGGKYHPCSECVDAEKANGNIYITNYGDRYHNDLNCSGIKRTIYMVKLRDVGGRTPCKRCGAWKE